MKNVAIVGSIAIDDLEGPFGSHKDVLGGSASYASLASSYLCPKTKLVGIIGSDMPKEYIGYFEKREIDLSELTVAEGQTFKWVGRYADDLLSRETLDTRLGVFGDYSPKLSDEAANTPIVLLGNIHPELQLHVFNQLKSPQLVVVDTMNFWIEGAGASLAKMLKKTDLLVLNDEEARLLSGQHSLVIAAEKIKAMGPKYVCIKRGDAGATLYYGDSVFAVPAVPLSKVEDPTGAGDSFAGGLVGYLAKQGKTDIETIKTGIVVGSAVASLAVEQFSVAGLLNVSLEAIQKRYDTLCSMSSFAPAQLD